VRRTWPEGMGCKELHTRYQSHDLSQGPLGRRPVGGTLDNRLPQRTQSPLRTVLGNLWNNYCSPCKDTAG